MRDDKTANLREASQNDPIADVCCDQDGGLLCGTKLPFAAVAPMSAFEGRDAKSGLCR